MSVETTLGRAVQAPSGYLVQIKVDTTQVFEASRTLDSLMERYRGVNERLVPLMAQVSALAALDSSVAGSAAQGSLATAMGKLFVLVESTRLLVWAVGQAATAYEQAEARANQLLAEYGNVAVPAFDALSAFGYNPETLNITMTKDGVKVSTDPKSARARLDVWLEQQENQEGMKRATGFLAKAAEITGLTGDLKAYTEVQETAPDYLDPANPIPLPPPPIGAPPRTSAEASRWIHRGHEYAHQATDAYTRDHLGLNTEWDGILIQEYTDHTTGETIYTVLVPGTDGDPLDFASYGNGGALSWESNPAAADHLNNPGRTPADSPAAVQLVLQALQAAGVPEGARIGFVGYSQGGMIAAALATNPAVRSRYRVDMLVTQNTPVHGQDLGGTPHLDITHQQDPIHRLQPNHPGYQPTEQVWVGQGDGMDIDDHSAHATADAAWGTEAAHEQSRVLGDFFDGDYVAGETHVYAGTTRDPYASESDLEFHKVAGLANGANAVAQEANIRLPYLHAVPSAHINPNDVLYTADRGIQYVDETLIQPADRWMAERLPDITIGDYNLQDPIIWDPLNRGTGKPPIPMPDDGITYYSPDPQLFGEPAGASGEPELAGAPGGAGGNF